MHAQMASHAKASSDETSRMLFPVRVSVVPAGGMTSVASAPALRMVVRRSGRTSCSAPLPLVACTRVCRVVYLRFCAAVRQRYRCLARRTGLPACAVSCMFRSLSAGQVCSSRLHVTPLQQSQLAALGRCLAPAQQLEIDSRFMFIAIQIV
jgi:hypothetical protein